MKKFGILLVLIFAMFLGRNLLFRALFRYETIRERKVLELKDEELNNERYGNIEDIIQSSLEQTSETLQFSFEPCENDPNRLLNTKKANCIGYSAFLAALIQNGLRENKLDEAWKVRHEVGEIYFLNQNIHRYFTSPFFKDHDFVVVENKVTKEKIAIDAAVYDYFRINNIRLK